ncbi:MAG: pyridoxamine 5'-phosphate oxidase family protein [Hyphomicrobiales bacterium]
MSHEIETFKALEALYKPVNPTSIAKETTRLTPQYRRWIERAPFLAIASSGPGGLDCSPRGDVAGELVHILSDSQIAIPDRRGNNRIDTLRNIVADPRVALLFLTPGINETMRINGVAKITTDPELIARFEVEGKRPVSVILVETRAVYFQCARALMRSRLWDVEVQLDLNEVPTAGEMIKGAEQDFDAGAYDGALRARQEKSLY